MGESDDSLNRLAQRDGLLKGSLEWKSAAVGSGDNMGGVGLGRVRFLRGQGQDLVTNTDWFLGRWNRRRRREGVFS